MQVIIMQSMGQRVQEQTAFAATAASLIIAATTKAWIYAMVSSETTRRAPNLRLNAMKMTFLLSWGTVMMLLGITINNINGGTPPTFHLPHHTGRHRPTTVIRFLCPLDPFHRQTFDE